MTCSIRRNYRGGRQQRSNVVHIEPLPDAAKYPAVKLRKRAAEARASIRIQRQRAA